LPAFISWSRARAARGELLPDVEILQRLHRAWPGITVSMFLIPAIAFCSVRGSATQLPPLLRSQSGPSFHGEVVAGVKDAQGGKTTKVSPLVWPAPKK
jgi:hypothetical protein